MALIADIRVCLECDVALFSRLLRNFRRNLTLPFPVCETLVWHLPRATKRKEGGKEESKEGRSKKGS